MKQYPVKLAILSLALLTALFPTPGYAKSDGHIDGRLQSAASLGNFSGDTKNYPLNQDPQPTEATPVDDPSAIEQIVTPQETLPAQDALPENLLLNDTASSYRVYLPAAITEKIYYVSTNGSDSNPGTSAKPWRTIQKAADTLVAGQTVKILPGTYRAKLEPRNSGAPGAFITFTADPGTVILDGSGLALNDIARGDGLVQIAGKSYIRVSNLNLRNSSVNCVNVSENSSGVNPSNIEITGLNIYNCRRTGIRARFTDNLLVKDNIIDHIILSSGIGVWWSNYVKVDHNTITNAHYYHVCQGAYEEALTISYTNRFEVKNNTLDNTEPPPSGSCNEAEKIGIDIKESSQNGLVYRNTVQNMNAASIYVDPWHAGANGKPTLNRINIFQNKISNSAGIIIGAEQADGIAEYINIFNNLLINTSSSGIQIRKAYGDGLRKNITIYHNTIYGALPSGGNGGAGISVTTSNLGSNNSEAPLVIRNNIVMFYFLTNGGGTVGQIRAGSAAAASKIAADHNIVYGPQTCSHEYPSCVEVGTRTSTNPGSVFINPGAFDLRLKEGAAAIDAGITVSLVSNDFQGVSRPQYHGYDIGAYEAQ